MSIDIQTDRLARFVALTARADGAEEICARVADGESLVDLAKAMDIPYARLAHWMSSDKDRAASYEGALRVRAAALVDESLGIVDNVEGSVERDKLRASHRLRIAGLFDRARFGDGVAGAGVRDIKVTIVQTMGLAPEKGEIHVGEHQAIESV